MNGEIILTPYEFLAVAAVPVGTLVKGSKRLVAAQLDRVAKTSQKGE